MKKTVLTLTVASLLLVTSACYAERNGNRYDPDRINWATPIEISSFCKAIMQGDIETVKSLIVLGEDVNRKSVGKTPAIFAARYNQAEILKVLIDNGADLTIRCDRGFTIKKHAELSNAKEVLTLLEEVM
ncbi:MAG: ankyrin repeat domain-containing protein [Maribacter sp.]|nr:ankyrin repeat domain-containing protein [Maribacter sp.]